MRGAPAPSAGGDDDVSPFGDDGSEAEDADSAVEDPFG